MVSLNLKPNRIGLFKLINFFYNFKECYNNEIKNYLEFIFPTKSTHDTKVNETR